MSKAIIWVSLFTVIAASLFTFSLNRHSWKPFRCTTQVSADIAAKNHSRVQSNVSINVIASQEDSSEIIVVGTIKEKNENYAVIRSVFITHIPADINGYSTTVITNEKRHPKDNVPDALWQHYILPEVPNVPFYVEIKNLRKNLLLYKGLDNPIFLCTLTVE